MGYQSNVAGFLLFPLRAGLAHLHSLNPPVIHMDFKTANVLVDENYIPKVADVGLRNFLRINDGAGPSQTRAENLFLDPG